MTEVPQVELLLRVILAAGIGAAVGIEREVHGHPAGMRTHLLVALGAGLFTVLSAHGFVGSDGDPARVAAQVVTGIGFLGAGAILKEGFTIRGLTTAASLWSTAALGMAAGLGQYLIAVTATAIVLISLWPLRSVADRLEGTRRSPAQVTLEVETLEGIRPVREVLRSAGLEVTGSRARRLPTGRYEVEVDIRRTPNVDLYAALASIVASTGVVVAGIDQPE